MKTMKQVNEFFYPKGIGRFCIKELLELLIELTDKDDFNENQTAFVNMKEEGEIKAVVGVRASKSWSGDLELIWGDTVVESVTIPYLIGKIKMLLETEEITNSLDVSVLDDTVTDLILVDGNIPVFVCE